MSSCTTGLVRTWRKCLSHVEGHSRTSLDITDNCGHVLHWPHCTSRTQYRAHKQTKRVCSQLLMVTCGGQSICLRCDVDVFQCDARPASVRHKASQKKPSVELSKAKSAVVPRQWRHRAPLRAQSRARPHHFAVAVILDRRSAAPILSDGAM